MSEFQEALERIVAGPERKSRVISDAEKAIIAYHEGGHAVVQRILPKCDPVAEGHDHQPRHGPRLHDGPADRRTATSSRKTEFEDKIAGLLGGNVAERLIFGDTTTGASNDIEKATDLARRMVTEFGMSDQARPAVASGSATSSCSSAARSASSATTATRSPRPIDEEVRAIIDQAYERATEVLDDPSATSSIALAEKLVAEETVDSDGFEALFSDLPPEGGHCTGSRPSSDPASRSRSPTPSRPDRRNVTRAERGSHHQHAPTSGPATARSFL